MDNNIQIQDSQVICTLCGRLDTAASEQFSQEYLQILLDNIDKPITLDLTQLDFISSAGLRILLTMSKACKAKGKSITLKNAKPELMKVFSITNMTSIFNFE